LSAVPAELNLSSPWRRAGPMLVALLLLIALLYRDTAVAMVQIWSRSDTFAHAFLVLPITLWLVWRQRDRLVTLTPRPNAWILLPMLGAALLWLVADLVVVNAAAQFAFVGLLVLAVPAVLGLEVALAILFPLLFLFFAVPFGEFMLQPMMEWTADFVVLALQLTGVPVFREGLQFIIPSGSWSVIDECSGVRYLIASFMVGTLFAYLNYSSPRRRAIFMGFSLLVPIVANWLRAYIIVMMGHLSGNTLAVGVDHIIYGWVFFGVVIFIMFTIGMRWSEPEPETDGAATPAASSMREPADGPRPAVLLAAAVLVLLPHLVVAGLQRVEASAAAPRLSLPERLAPGWAAAGPHPVAWAPIFANPAASASQAYSGPGGLVGVHVAYYRGQHRDSKLVSSQNGLTGLNDRAWIRRSGGVREVAYGGQTARVKATTLTGLQALGPRRPELLVWQAYWIDGRLVSGDAAAKLANAWARLRGRGDDGAALILYADAGDARASAAALEAFSEANLGALQTLLQSTRDGR
jgi:exosortase A